MTNRIYFDDNATTRLHPEVAVFLHGLLGEFAGNPSSPHAEGQEARRDLERAREVIASAIGCASDEVYFTGGASEANNLAILSAWEGRAQGRNRIVSTRVEHESVLKPLHDLKKKGAVIDWIESSGDGSLRLPDAFPADTALVCAMVANNETGVIHPLKTISLMARQCGAQVFADAVCAIGKIPVSFRDLGVDYLSASAHKFYGPRGAGFLAARKGSPLTAQIIGGSQERGVRAGTENLWAIRGMAKAIELVTGSEDSGRLRRLRETLKEGIARLSDVRFVEHATDQLPGTLNAMFQDVKGRTLLTALDLAGVSVSLGSACHSGSVEASHVLLAMGYSEAQALGAVRVSFGRLTTEDDAKEFLTRLEAVLSRIR